LKTEMNAMLDHFVIFILQTGMSENTAASYRLHMHCFFSWCKSSFDAIPQQLFRINILNYKSYLNNIKKSRPATINAHLSALLKFNRFLIAKGRQTDIVVRKTDLLRIQSEWTNPCTQEEKEIEALRQAILTRNKRHKQRNYALVTLMAYSGLRVSEAINIHLYDLSLSSNELLVRNGKGEKARTVVINDKIVQAIREYLCVRPDIDGNPYLFVSQRKGRLDRSTVHRVCKGVSDIYPHLLRHFFCSHSQNVAGYSLAETAHAAGHKDLRMTLRYTHPSKKVLLEKANRM